MALNIFSNSFVVFLLVLLSYSPNGVLVRSAPHYSALPKSDADIVEFALNLEYLEAEYFLYGALGYGLDVVNPNLTQGGPTPCGAKIAHLSPIIKDVTLQFALQEVGHLRVWDYRRNRWCQDGRLKVYVRGSAPRYFGSKSSVPNMARFSPCLVRLRVTNPYQIMINDISIFHGFIEAIKNWVKGFPRPLLNISSETFGEIIDNAFGEKLNPSFDPYANDINYLIASYAISYVGLNGYVGANPLLKSTNARSLIASLLGVESGQDAVIRALLYERWNQKVTPYTHTVAEFTNAISGIRNKLGRGGLKDEGLLVSKELGAEANVTGNILAGNSYSVSYARTPQEILRIVYGTSHEGVPGGFYPNGGDGDIVKSFLKN
ncbi:hypothetical protein PIB30_083894 [Stylosanthes scabra]|uniref:Desiccation-related protein PCC13-62 n=1 Tax=Stylosanthes scabra TaxID=79078 RepID=A0ABU6STG5_9FABA|nr:hypothetical protein [Stylosanthes scabra]